MKERFLFELQLIPRGVGKRLRWRFNTYTIIVIALAGILTWSAATYLIATALADFQIKRETATILGENLSLREHISRMAGRIEELEQGLQALSQKDEQLRLAADLPLIDPQVRQMGIGGLLKEPLSIITDKTVRQLITQLDNLERQVQLQQQSFQEIEQRLKEHSELLARTPSIRPVDGGYVSSGFGTRTDPFTRRRVFHRGVDISVPKGTPVKATADGLVVFAQQTPGLGKLVVIDHGYGFRTAYGHLNSINVVKGQWVKREQRIGTSGNTGRTTAPHLHYEVHVNGKPVNPVDFIYEDLPEVASLLK